MPYKSVWVDPEIFMEYKGVTVYHVYDYNDYEEGPMCYWYTLDQDCEGFDGFAFDVRELPVCVERRSPLLDREYSREVIRKAIDTGVIEPGMTAVQLDDRLEALKNG
jgi:hypothetical protein